ncbi:MAG: hypothetical protein ACYTBX_15470, partial [Planctomycetota bacterium]
FRITVNIDNRIILKDAWLFISSLNPFTFFEILVSHFYYCAYEMAVFAKLVDKGVSGCSLVV